MNNPPDKVHEKCLRYLLDKGYTEKEAWMLVYYLDSIIYPIFERYFEKLYKE